MRASIVVALALCVPLISASAQDDPQWRSLDVSRQLRDSAPQRIKVQYGAGRVDIRSTDAPLLYGMHLRYDELRAVPLHRYDAEQHSAVLGLESRGAGLRNVGRGDRAGEMRLGLARSVPLDLELELGGTEATLLATLKRDFASVKHVKPAASRSDSAELYVLATGFRRARD